MSNTRVLSVGLIRALTSGVLGGGGKRAIRRDGCVHGRWSVLGLVVGLAVAGMAPPAHADVGEPLWTVDIPASARCGAGATSSSGRAVAVVPGGKLNFPKFQSLLVTSCVEGGQAKLFFLDPSTNPATLVSTLDTSCHADRRLGIAGAALRQGRPHRLRDGGGLAEDLLDRLQQDHPQHHR